MPFIRINNRKNFLLDDVPDLHPSSAGYLTFWREQKKRVIEGFWGVDDDRVNLDISITHIEDIEGQTKWRWMPPQLYFYVNLTQIEMEDENSVASAPILTRPTLRDTEWEIFYNWIEARGFSGFEGDDNYTCLREVLDVELGNKTISDLAAKKYESAFKTPDKLKSYIPARDYLRKLHDKNLGKPLYQNKAKDLMLLGSRGIGKSYSVGNGVILHELITDGKKRYDKEHRRVEIFVGAGIASKSTDLLEKVENAMNNLKGAWAYNTDNEIPSPLKKSMSGTLLPNNKRGWRAVYEKKVAGEMKEVGSRSTIKHGIYTVENPEAAAGTRPTVMIIEEVGLLEPVLKVHACYAPGTKVRMFDGTLNTVENITTDSLIMGHDGTLRTVKKTYNGLDTMYKIKQSNGVSYTVNSRHKLYLEQFANEPSDGIFTTTAEEWYNSTISNRRKKRTYTLKSGEIEFPKVTLDIDPYFMGLYLGDGVVKSSGVCYHYSEVEIQDYLVNYYTSLGLDYYTREGHGVVLCCPTANYKRKGNTIRQALKKYNTLNVKHLHKDFQLSSISDRLQLLAGLLDSDGTLSKRDSGYEYVFTQTNRPELFDKVVFVARSLGFRVSTCNHVFTHKGVEKTRQQCTITGDIARIPCKVTRKQVPKDYKVERSSIRSSFTIEKLDVGEYYGFELNEDFRFLGEDNRICENSNEACQTRNGNKFGSSFYIGTGGNVDKIQESEIIFRDPEAYGFLGFTDEWEGSSKPIGFFIPAYYANNEFKDHNGNTDVDRAIAFYEKRREEKKGARSSNALDMEMMNYPIKPSEMFLNSNKNMFPVADLKEQLAEIKTKPHKYEDLTWFGELVTGAEGKITWKNKEASGLLREWPIKDNKNKPGLIQIFEMPKLDGEGKTMGNRYIVGTDTYDDDESSTLSLGSAFVIDTFFDRIVAEFTGRPETTEFYEITRRLTLFYNAENNYEQNKKGLFWHYEKKNSIHLLAETPKSLSDTSDVKILKVGNRKYGTTATVAVNAYALRLINSWLVSPDPTAEEGSGRLNLHNIKSIGLLNELISYNPNGNFDRISALGMALILKEDKYQLYDHSPKEAVKVKDLAQDSFFTSRFNKNALPNSNDGWLDTMNGFMELSHTNRRNNFPRH